MSFLFDQTKQIENIPSDIRGLRGQVGSQLGQTFQGMYGGALDPTLIQAIIGPMRELFQQNRAIGLEQAKESAGNLTGSGFANTLGATVQRSLADENALIADLINQERARVLQAITGFTTAGVAPPTTYTQPGVLSSVASGVGAAAPLAATLFGGPAAGAAVSALPLPGGWSQTPITQGGQIWRTQPKIGGGR
jgi:hypothetical protein